MSKKNYIVENTNIKIEKLVPGGQGLATTEEGIKGFFWNVLPGEIVTKYKVTKKKSSYFEAIALEINNSSKHRIEPKDTCFLSTSPWQIMDYDYELDQKKELVIEVYRQNNFNVSDMINNIQTDGIEFGYRNKMEYSLYWDIAEEKIKLAFHERGSHRKIPIENSSLERTEILEKAKEIIADLNARGEEAFKYQALLLRANQNSQVEGGLFENHKPHPIFNNLADTILGHDYSYSPNGFFQINLPVYELALNEIKKNINTAKVLDLYAGVGTIGLSVAPEKELKLVEVNESAYGEMVKNCESFDTKPEPILSKSEEALDYVEPDQTVIVDPPRAGCEKALLDKLLETLPPKIIYLSCNPATQARDVKILSEKYNIVSMTPFNFFPRTPHIENLVILEVK